MESLRRRRGRPEDHLIEIGLEKGMTVADIGAGHGFFAFPAAATVCAEGLVYAVEPDPKRAAEMAERAEGAGVKNIRIMVRGAEEIPEITTGEVDFAMSMSSFHHFADRGKALAELGRIVKPGGLLYIKDIKAGRVFRHGSQAEEFRKTVALLFPSAAFEESKGYLVAKVRL